MPESTPPPPRRVYTDEPGRPWWVYAVAGLAVVFIVGLLIVVSSPPAVDEDEQPLYVPPPSDQMSDVLLSSVISSLDRMEDFTGDQVIVQTLERLNQWLRSQRFDPDWQSDPLVAQLPEAFQQLPMVRSLRQPRFVAFDANHLQEVVLLSSVAKVARGDEIDDLARAQRLFDWVVRNVQVEPAPPTGAPFPIHLPRQVVVMGRGTVEERAWTFLLLARQQGLDAVVIAVPGAGTLDPPRLWVVALVSGSELYLFDPRLGLPLPGPDGQGVATLRQVVADDALLRQLDVEADAPYPFTAELAGQALALIEASPSYLCQRMAMVENHLSGDNRLVLSMRPTALAQRLASLGQLAQVGVWAFPYEQLSRVLERPFQEATIREAMRYRLDNLPVKPQDFRTPMVALQRARIFHLKGKYVSEGPEPSANALYQLARPTTVDIELAKLSPEAREAVVRAKQDATYWLGLVAYERGDYATAIDYLKDRTLETWPDGPWTSGARVNLARCYEALGQAADAVAWYRADQSLERPGSLVRAKRLLAAAGGSAAEAAASDRPPRVESTAPAEDQGAGEPGPAEPTPEPTENPQPTDSGEPADSGETPAERVPRAPEPSANETEVPADEADASAEQSEAAAS